VSLRDFRDERATMRFFLVVASRAFWRNESDWAERRVTCSVRDRWTDLSCAMAVSEEVIGVSIFFTRNLIVFVRMMERG